MPSGSPRARWARHGSASDRRRTSSWGFESRADLVSNVLLFIPLGYLLLAALCTDRGRRAGDVIAEETSGAIIGVLLWLAVGRPVTSWLRDFARVRERPAFIQYLLLGYVVAFLSSQLLPLDITINLAQLGDKFRMGRIVLVPFSRASMALRSGGAR